MWTSEQLAALKAAAAKGVTSLRIGNEMITYASVSDMLKLIATIEREVNPGVSRIVYPTFDRGTE
jgi:hypothetical protein